MRMRLRVLAPGAIILAAGPGAAVAADPPPAGTHVAAFRAPAAVTAGERAAVSGRIAPAVRATVRLQRLDAGGWVPLATVATDARGRFTAALPLRRSTNMRAVVVDADGGIQVSRRRFVALRPAVTLAVRPARYEAIAGRPHVVTGTVRPARPGTTVLLQGARGGAFHTLARLRVRPGGAVRGTVTPPAGGEWRFRLVSPASTVQAEGGATVRLSVFGANPHGVPSSSSHHIVQEINQMRLYYYEDGRLLRVLPVVFGAPSTPTPSGRYRVYAKGAGPGPAFGPLVLWYHRGYGIHGTNQEHLLARSWRYYSHGCTRNYNANIRWLWPRVPVGTPVVNVRS